MRHQQDADATESDAHGLFRIRITHPAVADWRPTKLCVSHRKKHKRWEPWLPEQLGVGAGSFEEQVVGARFYRGGGLLQRDGREAAQGSAGRIDHDADGFEGGDAEEFAVRHAENDPSGSDLAARRSTAASGRADYPPMGNCGPPKRKPSMTNRRFN